MNAHTQLHPQSCSKTARRRQVPLACASFLLLVPRAATCGPPALSHERLTCAVCAPATDPPVRRTNRLFEVGSRGLNLAFVASAIRADPVEPISLFQARVLRSSRAPRFSRLASCGGRCAIAVAWLLSDDRVALDTMFRVAKGVVMGAVVSTLAKATGTPSVELRTGHTPSSCRPPSCSVSLPLALKSGAEFAIS